MAQKNKSNYFDMFLDLAEYCCKSAEVLKHELTHFNVATLPQTIQKFHLEVEHAADERKHIYTNQLAKEFITPIEREDIFALLDCIDDITDNIEDTLFKVYMFCVKQIKPEALEFLDLIEQCCQKLKGILGEFRNFKKSHKSIQEAIIELNRLEGMGDRLYMDSVRALYEKSKDPVEIQVWTALYTQLERCCDACEDAANLVEEIVMKNS